MLKTEKHDCFLCGRDLSTGFILWDKTVKPRQEINSTIILEKDKMIHGKTVICQCGLAQEYEPMTESSLEEFYKKPEIGESIYRQHYPIPPGHTMNHMRNSIEFLFRTADVANLQGEVDILVIGSGDQEPLKMLGGIPLSKGDKGNRVYTFEPGLPVSDTNFNTKPDRQFDIIICNNVLEHVYNPIEFLKSMKGLCTPLTTFILSVPDLLTTSISMCKDRWFSNAHIYHFNFDSLYLTVTNAGYKIINHAIVTEEMGDKLYQAITIQDPLKPLYLEPKPLPLGIISGIKRQVIAASKLYTRQGGIMKAYEQFRTEN